MKRIIPCLDIRNGSAVKGKKFGKLQYAGSPAQLAGKYYNEGADELVLLDITASYERRKTMIDVVREVAGTVFIPFTVGGGISSIEDIRKILRSGADKASINTTAVLNPKFIQQAAMVFGSQSIVVAIDAKTVGKSWNVFIRGGREDTGLDAISWAREAERQGAGEILLTSIDCDGTTAGYDIMLTRAVSEAVNIPVIASGGAGSLGSIAAILTEGKADAALCSSIFHYGKYTVGRVKNYLQENNIGVRL